MNNITVVSSTKADTNASQLGLTVAPRQIRRTFMDFDLALDLEHLEADIAILGLPYGDSYIIDEVTNDQTNAPTAIRQASRRISGGLERWDFDLGSALLHGKPVRVVDCGDVPGDARDLSRHYSRAEKATRLILRAGAFPIVLGGDHGVSIPVLRAFEGRGQISLIQIDAPLDWGAHKHGDEPQKWIILGRSSRSACAVKAVPEEKKSKRPPPTGHISSPTWNYRTVAWIMSWHKFPMTVPIT